MRLRGRHALFPPRGEEKKAKVETVRHASGQGTRQIMASAGHGRKLAVVSAFSKRHRRALSEARLIVDVNPTTRSRVARLLARFDDSFQTDFNNYSRHTEELREALLDLYGSSYLPGERGSSNLNGFLASADGPQIFDALEIFRTRISNQDEFVTALNELLSEEDSAWRMLSGQMVLLDGAFAREELVIRGELALQSISIEGASLELQRALNHVVDGDGRGAIHNAGSSYESLLKALLSREDGTAKKLLQDLQREGFFDDLPSRLRQPFIREVLMALPWMRNELGGHGQGESPVDIPKPYAQLATDLAYAFAAFLIAVKVESEGRPVSVQRGPASEQDFAPALATGDDDIPF
jgi:hypothetical protein